MTDQPTTFELVLSLNDRSGITDEARRNRQLMEDAYKAMLAGNSEEFDGLLDPAVTFHEARSLPFGCDYAGIEGAQKGVQGMFSAWTHLRAEFFDFAAAGDLVIAYLLLTGTSRYNGEIYEGFGTEVFRFRNGKVIEWRPFYWDTHAVRKVCGVAG